jgi:hypothetical protein
MNMDASIEVRVSLARIATVLERLLTLVEADRAQEEQRDRALESERVSDGPQCAGPSCGTD